MWGEVVSNQFLDDQTTPTMTSGVSNATAAGSTELRAVGNRIRTSTGTVPMLNDAGGEDQRFPWEPLLED